ncbi:glycosyltransferase family 39 protein [Hymenobacter sp. 5317J-9]|uniref:glycosyltransferase family 39 protein n=1 Tax=Hymenobacter sp. 5317J-9 TaxID=2932250 RepID=UPI001FD66752|nr:glycosyltransferase family 39 protein [Hymenobacter sp. 5317J-9]UOQ96300.1 glycosyltransferase family 39 protein [Hymenobacter sp. 5317J-9]
MTFFRRRFGAASRIDWLALGLLGALAVLFGWQAGTPVLHVWDEARLAVNAAEMLQSGDWLVTRYNGQPDLWNTKPPLLIWLQAGCLHVLGYNMWALRLPSVLAALGTAGLLYRFGCRTLRSRFVGAFAALILATSPGFNGTHVSRFGDYDALLTLALTATALQWYRYAHQRQAKQLWRGAAWFAVALLTKSAAAVLLLPAVGAGWLALPGGRWATRQWRTYGAIIGAFGPLLLFYLLREAAAPGYLAATWFNDWYGRISQHIVTVQYPWWIYFQRLFFPGLLTWSWLLPVGGWLASSNAAALPRRHFARFAGLLVLTFLVIISAARTRLGWYSAPVYPLAALLCALGLEHVVRAVRTRWRWSRPVVVGLLTVATAMPAGLLLYHEHRRWESEKADPMLHFGYQLPPLLTLQPRPRAVTIVQAERYQAVLLFYVAALRQAGIAPAVVAPGRLPQLRPGQRVLVCSDSARSHVLRQYRAQPEPAMAGGTLLQILGSRE